jgi:hypothetical protein
MVPISRFGADRSAKSRPQGCPARRAKGGRASQTASPAGWSVSARCLSHQCRTADRQVPFQQTLMPSSVCVSELTNARRRRFCHAIGKPLSLCFAARSHASCARASGAIRSRSVSWSTMVTLAVVPGTVARRAGRHPNNLDHSSAVSCRQSVIRS